MRQRAKAPAPPHRPRPPRTRTRPLSPRELSRAFYATSTARKIRITPAVRATMRVLLDAAGEELYGEQIADRADLRTGTIYQLLARLASAGWITSRKEDQQTCQDRNRHQPCYRLRIRRTYHTLTHDGRKAALHELTPRHAQPAPPSCPPTSCWPAPMAE
jgi:Fe2+ or Zn2+ uptake regulation protein